MYIPSKRFSATDQFTENLCFETMSIANVRVHVESLERAINLRVRKSDMECLCFANKRLKSNHSYLKKPFRPKLTLP